MSSNISKNLVSYAILALPLLLIAFFTYRSYNGPRASSLDIEKVNNSLDMPLDKVAIWLDKDAFEDAVDSAKWARKPFSLSSREVRVEPTDVNEFVRRVNPKRVMRLMKAAKDCGIKMDGEALVLPVKEDRVLVPTWVVYALAEDGYFDTIKR